MPAKASALWPGLKENGQRDRVVLANQGLWQNGRRPQRLGVSRYHLLKACEDSLRRLQTDHIDLYQLHRPPLGAPQDETLRAFDDLIRAGKVRYIGCSTHPAWMVMEALAVSERHHLARYVSEQPPTTCSTAALKRANPPGPNAYPGDFTLVAAGRRHFGRPLFLSGECPKVRGRSARSHFPGSCDPPGREVALKVAEMAQERGLTVSQLALLWVKDQPASPRRLSARARWPT